MKIKAFLKKNKLYFICFLSMVAILNIIFFIKNIYPYGKNILITKDFYYQYYPMLIEFSNRIKNFSSLMYSFNDGLGLPLYRNFFNYLSSPFNLIFLLFKNTILSAHLIIIIKIIFISLTTLYYLKKKFDSDDILLLIPSISFSLCGWISAYYLNIMWIDALIFIPLITLGIEKLVDNHKCLFYIITLFLMIISNYYMGYMMCVYSLVYFLIYNVYKIKKIGSIKYKINELSRNFLIFICSSVISVLLCSFMMLPLMYASTTMSGKLDILTSTRVYSFNIIDFLSSHFARTIGTALTENPLKPKTPNIYVGLLSIILFITFIFDNNIKKPEKIFYIILLLSFAIFFFVPFFDYIINLFHTPVGFPYRYSFMYSFILIIIMTYELLNINRIKLKYIIISIVSILIILILALVFKTTKINANSLYINIILIISIFSVLLISKKYKIGKYILISLTLFELVISFNYKEKYMSIDDNNKLMNKYDINIHNNNESFYRMEIVDSYHNLPLLYNYYGISHSSSMSYFGIYDLMFELGNGADFSAFTDYLGYNPVTNILFGIKYVYDDDTFIENKEVLPLMYGIDKKTEAVLNYEDIFFINTNKVVKDLSNVDELFTKNIYQDKELIHEDDDFVIYKYKYEDDTYIEFNATNVTYLVNDNKKYTLYESIDYDKDIKYDEVDSYKNPFMIKVENNEIIVCFLKDDYSDSYIRSYKLDKEKLENFYNYLNKDLVNITKFKEDYIEGNINITKDKAIMTSIPYDKGWHVYIDDKEVKTYSNYDALLGFDIKKGKHNIKLKYKIPYFKIGSLISLGTFIIIISYHMYVKKSKKNI